MPGTERTLTLRFLAEPADVNFGGKVHGGAVMKWIDLSAYGCAAGWSGKYCITAYVGGMHFVKPILVGSIVEVEAKVIYTGKSSMHIRILVRAGDPKSSERELCTHCIAVMVAMDENGTPSPVPDWVPQTEQDKHQRDSALKLMAMRDQIRAEMKPYIEP